MDWDALWLIKDSFITRYPNNLLFKHTLVIIYLFHGQNLFNITKQGV